MALERCERTASELLVEDAGGGERKLSEFWNEGPVVLYFHRHFG